MFVLWAAQRHRENEKRGVADKNRAGSEAGTG